MPSDGTTVVHILVHILVLLYTVYIYIYRYIFFFFFRVLKKKKRKRNKAKERERKQAFVSEAKSRESLDGDRAESTACAAILEMLLNQAHP